MYFISLMCLAVFSEVSVQVHGWGLVGHSIVVRLAQSQLNELTSEWIRTLIPWHWNGNLSAMATWADDILYPDTNRYGYENWQWSRELHYINILDWSCNYESEKDCMHDRCVLGAIKNYTKRLTTETDDVQQREALYFLIHFLADIHQPLHVGFRGDRGGNNIRGRFMNRTLPTNLHSLWDTDLIMTRLERDFQQNISLYYDYIDQLMQSQVTSDGNDDIHHIERWIQQNINLLCSQIYFDENNAIMNSSVNFDLGEIYYQKNIPNIEQHLARGGRRLGLLLNEIAMQRAQKSSQKNNTLCSGTIALIVVLCAEILLAAIIGIIIWRRRKSKSFTLSSNFIIPGI